MTYVIRWHSASGKKRQPSAEDADLVEYATLAEAQAAMIEHLREAAAVLEHGTGKPGWWTRDGELWCDDMFHDDAPLGRYVIEQVAP